MKLHTAKNVRFKLAAAVAATLLTATAAHADVEVSGSKLKLAAYVDTAAGDQLMEGNYSAVIQTLAPHAYAYNADEVAASTNLCVAYVAAGQLDAAHTACDEAVKMARMDKSTAKLTLAEHIAHEDALALAVSNRAVLTKLSGE
jgi:Tetratricopeptide repeat